MNAILNEMEDEEDDCLEPPKKRTKTDQEDKENKSRGKLKPKPKQNTKKGKQKKQKREKKSKIEKAFDNAMTSFAKFQAEADEKYEKREERWKRKIELQKIKTA